jgi:FAD:protein FMN transferase
MRPVRSQARAFVVVLLLAALAGGSVAHAAKTSARNTKLATATGPETELSRPLALGSLTIRAAARGDLQDPAGARNAIAAAFEAATQLATDLAAGAGGELDRLQAAAGAERFACSPDLYAVLDAALAVSAATDGAYDPTAGPLARLRAHALPAEPDPLALADARQLVGWRLLLLEPGGRTVRFRRPGMELALGAVARGRVLARAATVLRERGIARARLELPGELVTFTGYEAWSVTVPRPDADGPAMHLRVSNAAVATAGGIADRDLFDPRTGRRPGGDGSVTVVGAAIPEVRAIAEALRVLGRDGAADYARRHPDVGVLWLEPSGDVLQAWSWNLDALSVEPGLRVEWREAP